MDDIATCMRYFSCLFYIVFSLFDWLVTLLHPPLVQWVDGPQLPPVYHNKPTLNNGIVALDRNVH